MKRQPVLVDIGNSTTVIALLESSPQIISKIDTSQFQSEFPNEIFKEASLIVVSSVVPEANKRFDQYKNVIHVTAATITTISVNLKTPDKVGADRLVNALAAYTKYKTNCLIIDSGTAITFCHITQNGVYQGGTIFPGMGIASRALNDYTAKIPLIWVSPQESLFGKTTEEAVQSGLYHGYIEMINGMIRRYREQVPGITVIGTGTGLEAMLPHIGLDHHEPNLILEGLAMIAKSVIQ
jgi:type III pantothenate kinase